MKVSVVVGNWLEVRLPVGLTLSQSVSFFAVPPPRSPHRLSQDGSAPLAVLLAFSLLVSSRVGARLLPPSAYSSFSTVVRSLLRGLIYMMYILVLALGLAAFGLRVSNRVWTWSLRRSLKA